MRHRGYLVVLPAALLVVVCLLRPQEPEPSAPALETIILVHQDGSEEYVGTIRQTAAEMWSSVDLDGNSREWQCANEAARYLRTMKR